MSNADALYTLALAIHLKKEAAVSSACIYVVRHGKTALNAGQNSEDRIRGWVDVPLDQSGLRQAEHDGEILKGLGIKEIHSSDLSRAETTASIIAERLGIDAVHASKNFRPWNLGELQGKASKDAQPVLQAYVKEGHKTVPEGECFLDFAYRFLPAFKKLLHRSEILGKPLLLCTHYRGVKLLEAWIAGKNDDIDLPTFFKDDVQTGEIFRLEGDGKGGWKMHPISGAKE
jgi:broad specificity phosphatase PhoE